MTYMCICTVYHVVSHEPALKPKPKLMNFHQTSFFLPNLLSSNETAPGDFRSGLSLEIRHILSPPLPPTHTVVTVQYMRVLFFLTSFLGKCSAFSLSRPETQVTQASSKST